jgi:predicted hydrocarbon binding protein
MADSVVLLPSSVLVDLADRCAAAGEFGIAALREAGRGFGLSLYDSLAPDRSVEELDPEEFWAAVGQKLQELGFGPLRYEQVDEGLAAVCVVSFPEAGSEEIGGGLLSRAADQSIAVLEIECRADGSHGCWFLLGAQERLESIHEKLRSGEPIENAIKGI